MDVMYKQIKMTIPLPPVTKKNSQRIVQKRVNGKTVPIILPSAKYKEYEKAAAPFVKPKDIRINYPVTVTAIYYMPTRRRVDRANLDEALDDILVKYGVLEDDNCKIIASTDGTRVKLDREHPRTEVTITVYEEGDTL